MKNTANITEGDKTKKSAFKINEFIILPLALTLLVGAAYFFFQTALMDTIFNLALGIFFSIIIVLACCGFITVPLNDIADLTLFMP